MAYPKFQPSEWLTTYRANLSSADASGLAFADEQEAAERELWQHAHDVAMDALGDANDYDVTDRRRADYVVAALIKEGLIVSPDRPKVERRTDLDALNAALRRGDIAEAASLLVRP